MAPEIWKLLTDTQSIDHLQVPLVDGHLAIMDAEVCDDEIFANAQELVDVEFEVALDSGSTDNVCHELDPPGYMVEPSAGSRRGQRFVIGDGNKIANDGQANLNLQITSGFPNDTMSTFQVAKVSRPLMSVGKICDNDLDVLFNQIRAKVSTRMGDTICTLKKQHGGLYIAKLRLRRPGTPTHFVRRV